MRARFLHMADCHLGYRQYGRNERFNDFSKAFYAVIDVAVQEKVDFVLLAGDLFQKRAIDALTLHHAMRGLERLQRAGIPCLAVEGNHELAYYSDSIGWMRFLAERELLILLDPEFTEGEPMLTPYAKRRGAYMDVLPGLRVYGLRYYGSSTPSAIEKIGAALAESDRSGVEYTVFMAHTGIEGVLAGEAGGLTHRQLAPLRPHVDYLALGHVHKPFEFDGWIYNPGSLETSTMTEAAWPERGYYLVEVDTARERAEDEPVHRCQLCPCPRRDFVRLAFRVDHYDTPESLLAACRDYVQREAADRGSSRHSGADAPVVELRLYGVLPFDRGGLELDRYEAMVEECFSPLLAQIKNTTQPTEFAVAADSQLNRRELEQQIIGDLLARDSRFASHREEWTRLALSLKELALTGASPEAILDELNGASPVASPPQE